MRFSDYFERERRNRPDRANITIEMCEQVRAEPLEDSESQPHGRTAYWGHFPEWDRYLRVVVEPDGEVVFNAFWDRNFRRRMKRKGRG